MSFFFLNGLALINILLGIYIFLIKIHFILVRKFVHAWGITMNSVHLVNSWIFICKVKIGLFHAICVPSLGFIIISFLNCLILDMCGRILAISYRVPYSLCHYVHVRIIVKELTWVFVSQHHIRT